MVTMSSTITIAPAAALALAIWFNPGAAQETAARRIAHFGSLDGPGAIGSIRDITLDGEGHVFVADGLAAQILVFYMDGTFLRALGRKGGGPGEYLSPGGIGWRDGRLWVYDAAQRRVTTVTVDGSVVGTFRFSAETLGPEGIRVGGLGPFGDRHLGLALPRSELIAHRLVADRPVYLVDDVGFVSDTLTLMPLAEREISAIPRGSDGSESPAYLTELVKAHTILDLSPSGDRLLTIERPAPDAPEAEFRMQVHEAGEGRILDKWISVTAERLTDDWLDSKLDPLFDEDGRMGFLTRREVEAHLWKPDYHPPVSQAKIGADGSIWIAREPIDDDQLRWVVYDLDGTLQFTTRLPADLRVYWVSRSEVWGARPGHLDVPQVEGYRIGS